MFQIQSESFLEFSNGCQLGDKHNALSRGAQRVHRPQFCFFVAPCTVLIMPTMVCNVSLNQNKATSRTRKKNSIGLQAREAAAAHGKVKGGLPFPELNYYK